MESKRDEVSLSISFGATTHNGSRYHQLNQDYYLCLQRCVDSSLPMPAKLSKLNKTSRASKESTKFTGGGGLFSTKPVSVGHRNSHKDKLPAGKSKMHAWCIFDGHDLLGEMASQIAAQTFEAHLNLVQGTTLKNDEILAMFKAAHRNILDLYDNPPEKATYVAPGYKALGEYSLSYDRDGRPVYTTPGAKSARPLEFGTTALLCVLFEETKELIVAWVGDSKAILVSKDLHSDDMMMQDLTISHNGKNPDEEARIRRDYGNTVSFSQDGYICPRVASGPAHHLAMTRALGHKSLYDYGVIPEPQVRRVKVKENDFFMIAASDGVWDNLSDSEILDTVLDHSNPIKGATALVNTVMDVTNMKMVDNTTAVLVHFDLD